MIIGCNVFAQNQTDAPNAVTSSQQCMEFGYLADMYAKKAGDGGIYAEKYILIAQNFKKMHVQCIETTNSNTPYSGYRSNVTQQLQTQVPAQSQKTKK